MNIEQIENRIQTVIDSRAVPFQNMFRDSPLTQSALRDLTALIKGAVSLECAILTNQLAHEEPEGKHPKPRIAIGIPFMCESE